MGLSYLIALLLSGVSLVRLRLRPADRAIPPDPATPLLPVTALSLASCILYLCQRYMVEFAGAHQHIDPMPSWFAGLPLAFLLQGSPYQIRWDGRLVVLLQTLALAQCAILTCIFVVLRRVRYASTKVYGIVAAAALFMLGTALRAHTMSGDDLYLYVGLALVGPSAYHPDATPLGGVDAIVNQLWGVPIFPSPYGPLWIAISKAAISGAHTLYWQLECLRYVQTAALVVSAGALFLLTRALLLPALLVLNPIVYDLYIVDAHNDLTGVAFVLAAAACRRHLWLAVPLAACAGLVKLPFVLVAMMAFAAEPTIIRRALPALASAALAFGASFAAVGADYSWALRRAFVIYGGSIPTEARVLQILSAAAATFAVALAITRRRYVAGASWSFVAFGHFPFPWYLGWGVPYAVLCEPPVIAFFITWPLANALLTTYFPPSPILTVVRYGLIAGLSVAIALGLRRMRAPLRPEPQG